MALRVVVSGDEGRKAGALSFDLLDCTIARTGISAMMRTTGFSLSLTAQLQATGRTPKGVLTPDEAMPYREYVEGLAAHGVTITEVPATSAAPEPAGRW